MKLTNEQETEFRKLAKRMMDFLANNCHPHTSVSIDSVRAELKEGVVAEVRENIGLNEGAEAVLKKN